MFNKIPDRGEPWEKQCIIENYVVKADDDGNVTPDTETAYKTHV